MVQLVLKSSSASEKESPPERTIARLEESLARLRLALAVVLGLALLPWIGVALVWERKPTFEQWRDSLPKVVDLPCEIKAQAFRALSREGREVAFVGRGADGGGNLTLRDDHGGKLLVAGDFDGHGGFLELGNAEQIATHLGAGETAAGFLLLRDGKGTDLAYVGVDPHGDGRLFLNRADGTDLLTVARSDHDESYLTLLGPKGTVSAMLVANEEGGRLDLFDGVARKFLYAGPSESGSGFVKVLDDDGSLLAVFGTTGTTPRGGFFEAFNADEQPLFYGGRNHERGDGLLNVCTSDGRMLVAIGIDGQAKGGVLNVFDLAGEMVLRLPDWK